MNINLQDYLAIVASILGPILTLMGFMWHNSNSRFEKLDEKISSVEEKLGADIKRLEEKLGEKIDVVRGRVSRIEGQLAPTSVVSFNPLKHKAS